MNSLIRFTRVGKVYKLIKITRLIRLLKVIKQQQKIMKKLNKMYNIGRGIEKLTYIVLVFLMVCHLMACIWIFIADMNSPSTNETDTKTSWIAEFGFSNQSMDEIYVASLYYMVTTIATVGYGDIYGTNMTERIICIFMMITGVFFFSFASGSLTHVITHREAEELKTVERLNILNKIYKDYKLNSELYYSILYLIESENKETQDINEFLEELPMSIRHKVSMFVFKNTHEKIKFLDKMSTAFITWLCPLLQQLTF